MIYNCRICVKCIKQTKCDSLYTESKPTLMSMKTAKRNFLLQNDKYTFPVKEKKQSIILRPLRKSKSLSAIDLFYLETIYSDFFNI